MKKNKMYHAKQNIDVVFCSSLSDPKLLEQKAKEFLAKEAVNKVPDRFSITEIKDHSGIPVGWKGFALIWGADGEYTAEEFLLQEEESAEYKEYLRLKAKFE